MWVDGCKCRLYVSYFHSMLARPRPLTFCYLETWKKNTFEWWSKQWLVVFDEGWPLRAEYLRIVMAHSSPSYHWNNIAVRVRTLLTFPLQLSNENGLTLVGVLLVFYACCTFSTACLSCQKCAVKCFQQAAVSGQFVDVRKAPCPDSCMLQ